MPTVSLDFGIFVLFVNIQSCHRLQEPSFPKALGLLKFPCVLFWPVCPAWRASQHSSRVNVSCTRLLMRPETKERADTIIGSVLRGSFTLYRRQLEIWGERGGDGSREAGKQRAGEMRQQEENVGFSSANTFQRQKRSHWLNQKGMIYGFV